MRSQDRVCRGRLPKIPIIRIYIHHPNVILWSQSIGILLRNTALRLRNIGSEAQENILGRTNIADALSRYPMLYDNATPESVVVAAAGLATLEKCYLSVTAVTGALGAQLYVATVTKGRARAAAESLCAQPQSVNDESE
eukprot:1149573-Pelagomonas_calceolata.AAC.2